MCGIAGWFITRPQRVRPQTLRRLGRSLLLGIEPRGHDATGYAYISRRDKHAHVAKAPVPATEFLDIEGHLMTKPNVTTMPREMLFHTRYATQGKPADNMNNHPLYSKVSGLTMIHNGWLINDDELVTEFDLKKDAEVDSETYLKLIEKFYLQGEVKNVEAGISEATKVVWGNIVCAMLQASRPGVMWLWRDSGDLCLVRTDWGYVFASTKSAVLFALHYACKAIDLSWYEVLNVPKASLIVFNQSDEPRLVHLEPMNWQQSKFRSRVSVIEANGEVKVRRNRTAGTTYECYDEYNGYIYGGGHWDAKQQKWVWTDEDKPTATSNGTTTESTKSGVSNILGLEAGAKDNSAQASPINQSIKIETPEKEIGFDIIQRPPHAANCFCEGCSIYWEHKLALPNGELD